MRPPITAVAIGMRKLGSAPKPIAIGSIPAPMAMVVITMGRARLLHAPISPSALAHQFTYPEDWGGMVEVKDGKGFGELVRKRTLPSFTLNRMHRFRIQTKWTLTFVVHA
jgi:hypothetical protein